MAYPAKAPIPYCPPNCTISTQNALFKGTIIVAKRFVHRASLESIGHWVAGPKYAIIYMYVYWPISCSSYLPIPSWEGWTDMEQTRGNKEVQQGERQYLDDLQTKLPLSDDGRTYIYLAIVFIDIIALPSHWLTLTYVFKYARTHKSDQSHCSLVFLCSPCWRLIDSRKYLGVEEQKKELVESVSSEHVV